MSVNLMSKEDASLVLASLHQQVTGQNTIAATSLEDFISMAQSTLRAGYDPVLNAISQMVGRTIIAVRPYDEKFKGLEVTGDQYGAITRKINYVEGTPESEQSYALTNGSSIDDWVVKKPEVLETHYYGSDTWSDTLTVFTTQIRSAFTSPEALGEFMSGLMTHFANERKQWLEDMKRAALCNFIGAKYASATAVGSVSTDQIVHLLTEYNTASGQSLTATTVYQAANFAPFVRWCYARINSLARLMSERSEKFQQRITGKPIMRHTSPADLRAYILAPFADQIKAMVLADTYGPNFLKAADFEPVSFWQAIEDPDEISITPAFVDGDLQIDSATALTLSGVVGVLFDRDAVGYNIFRDDLETSAYNAHGSYYNLVPHVDVRLWNDISEKGVVLFLD